MVRKILDAVVALPASITAAAAADQSQLSSELYLVSLAQSTSKCQRCCTVTALPFASPAAFRQLDSLAANCQLRQLGLAALCQRSFTQPASNQ